MSESKTTYIMPDQTGNNDFATLAMMSGGGLGNNMWNNPLN